jgi:hypothetical protein
MSDLPVGGDSPLPLGNRAASLPLADDLLGHEPQKPSADDLLGIPPDQAPQLGESFFQPGESGASGGGVMEGPLWDAYASQGPVGRILSAFGQSAKEGWGASSGPPLEPDIEDILRKTGLFDSYQEGHNTFTKSINEAFLRHTATNLWLSGSAIGAAGGAVQAAIRGVQGAVEQTGAELGVPQLGRDIAALPEALIPEAPHFAAEARGPIEATPAPAPMTQIYAPRLPPDIAEARAYNVIGPGGEAAWKGTNVITGPEEDFSVLHDQVHAAQESATKETPGSVTPPALEPPQVQPTDVRAVARQMQPELFDEFDGLDARREMLRRQLDDVSQHPAITALDDQIQTLRGQRLEAPPGQRVEMANRLIDLEAQRQAWVDQIDNTEARQQTRLDIVETTHRMWDLAPDIRAADEAAAARRTPIETAPETAPVEPPAEEASPAATPVAEAPTPTPQAPAGVPIAQDVSRQLVAAGRPADEAEAVGAIQAARYEARAANLGTTPEQLYAEEGPAISAGTGQQRGNISLNDSRATIRLMANADASTAIHELGHSYLEELIRDSADDRATDAVKTDSDTVQKWLGVEEGESPTRRQHEKFARGFERYMMEGRAPTAELASVFSKFKDWLTTIYQTVSRLRSPISDDIRKVFDRMLTAPERPALTSEEQLGFADRHETIADRTPPEKATQEADLIRSEADKVAAERAPEIHAELIDAERRGGGVGERAGASEQSDRNADAAQSDTSGPATAGPVGAVGAGGSEAAAESPGVRPVNEFPNNPTANIPRGDTDLVDKAGNIRLDNIETPEDFKEALRQAAERNDDFLERRRGVVSDAQRMALADVLGLDPSSVITKEIGESFSDSEIKYLEKTLAQSANMVRDAAVKAAGGKPEDIVAFAEAMTRNDMIQGLYSQATAEAGRALRSLRRTQEYWTEEGMETNRLTKELVNEATGRTLNQMQQIAKRIAQLDQAGPINKFTRDVLRPGVFDYIQSWFINALLSGPFTHAGYTAAGQIFGLFRGVGETAGSAFVGALRAGITGAEDRALVGEMPHQLYGQFRGARSGISVAWEALKANRTVLPPEVEALNPSTGQAIGTVAGTIPGVFGKVIESPSRMVAALHSFNWSTFYSQSISGQAFRQATSEKLNGQAFSARVAELTQTPTEAMIKEASDDANSGALVTRPAYDRFMGNLSRLTNIGYKVPDFPLPGGSSVPMGTLRPVKYIDPFVQIAANVLKTGFGRGTPLALFSQDVRDDLSMRNGGVAFDRQAGKILAGTGFMIAAGGLANQGLLNWSGPDRSEDQGNKARAWARIYGMPHGLQIGSLSFDVLRLGNIGLQMSVAADLYHVAATAGSGDVNKAASELVMAFAHNILDESFARGPAEMMRAVDESDRYGAQWVRNFAKSFVPFSVGLSQVAREIDPYSRQARTTMDAIKAGLPFVSETLQPIYDVWGQPVSNRGWALTYYEPLHNDPVDSKLYELGIYPSLPERRIVNVALTDQQYADVSRIGGRIAHMRVSQIVQSPGFSMQPVNAQIFMIKHAMDTAREVARTQVKMAPENRGILNAANAAIRAKLHGEKMPAGGWPQTVH